MFGRSSEDRLTRLAKNLDRVVERDRVRQERERRVEHLRRQGGAELYSLCKRLALSLNDLLSNAVAVVTPDDFNIDGFEDRAMHLVQISINGRIVQLTYQPTAELESTEHIRIPYTLEGSVRWFNQEMIERDDVRDHGLYYCVNGDRGDWRFVDPVSRKLGPVTDEYLIGLLEQLI